MEPQIYAELAQQEDRHWWFFARRAIVASLLKHLKLPSNAKVLDAGCGSGGNLPFLAGYGELYAFEMDDMSRARAESRAIAQVKAGSLPGAIPFDNQAFDLITLFDVLEHVEDDRAALTALAGRLNPGGLLVINVPAFQWMFSQHDVLHHHFRRYGWADLKQKVEAAGLKIRVMNYWNSMLFPVAAAARLFERVRPSKQTMGTGAPPPMMNKLVGAIVSCERFLVSRLRLPFGTSLIVIAEKQGKPMESEAESKNVIRQVA